MKYRIYSFRVCIVWILFLFAQNEAIFCQTIVSENIIKSNRISGSKRNPEPTGWYSGDIHVHRNCGDGTKLYDEGEISSMMTFNNLSVISLLADMGNGEVKDSKVDLAKVNGRNSVYSTRGHIIHWDTEWHWDATYSNFDHQALGGHLVILGLQNAHQIWEESPYRILAWAKKQHAVCGFAHFEYLKDSFQNELNCCIPIEYPVEAALGTIDFISEDVYGLSSHNNGNYNSEAVIQAYYRLLNCGFRIGLAAGTDFPCNELEPPGTLLTYVLIKNGDLSYQKWINGIKKGRTVISRNGHNEFVELRVNDHYGPGDEMDIKKHKQVTFSIKWSGVKNLAGRIELVCNGKVIAGQTAAITLENSYIFKTTLDITSSSWICARRMDERGHVIHTAPVYIIINGKPIRANAEDARYYIDWIDQLIEKTSPGGAWDHYFTNDISDVQARYQKAKNIYKKILEEAKR